MRAERDAGYAVIAAMVAAAGIALVSAQVISTSHDAVVTASAQATRNRQEADAEAGMALALDGLQAPDPAARWSIDGYPRTLDFDGSELTIRVEDERGKIPLNTVTPSQVRTMFQLAGADPQAVDALTAAFMARREPPLGSGDGGNQANAIAGAPGRPSGFDDLRDLLLLPGMTPELYAAIAPSASVDVRDAAFEPRTATPLSLEVMTGAAAGSPDVIARRREFEGETALDTAPPLALAGRPLTLRVEVRDQRNDVLERAEVVEFTRAPAAPYVVRRLSADGSPVAS